MFCLTTKIYVGDLFGVPCNPMEFYGGGLTGRPPQSHLPKQGKVPPSLLVGKSSPDAGVSKVLPPASPMGGTFLTFSHGGDAGTFFYAHNFLCTKGLPVGPAGYFRVQNVPPSPPCENVGKVHFLCTPWLWRFRKVAPSSLCMPRWNLSV